MQCQDVHQESDVTTYAVLPVAWAVLLGRQDSGLHEDRVQQQQM